MGIESISGYFPGISLLAEERFEQLPGLYNFWNERINVISRKDLPNLYLNHILHSLSLSKVIPFAGKETVLDVGTGGGFPGIPLAIMHPEVYFTLIDSTGKKIKVVENIARELNLTNITVAHVRAESFTGSFHYIISRAVCAFSRLVELSAGKLIRDQSTRSVHGIYSLKGGDLQDELAGWEEKIRIIAISSFFREEFFRTKSLIFLPSMNIPS